MLPQSITELTEKFRSFPGVGFRSGQKLSLDILQMSEEDYEEFLLSLDNIRKKVKICNNCGFFAEAEICDICSNKNRNNSQICLVENPTDVLSLERSENFRGKYHVLNNLIAPLENIFPEDTTLSDLLDRRLPELAKTSAEIELILFFKAGFSAEATTAYLRESISQRKFKDKIKITRLAQGLPLYYNPDTLDSATMSKALEDRRSI